MLRSLWLLALLTLGFPVATIHAADAPKEPAHLLARLDGSGGDMVYFSPDGSKLLTVGGEVARVWDAQTFRPLTPPIKHGAAIDDAGWAAGGERFFTAGGTSVRLWDGNSGAVITTLLQDAPVKPTCISPDGDLVVTGNAPGPGTVWDVKAAKVLYHIDSSRPLDFALISRDGKKLVIVGERDLQNYLRGRSVRLLELPTGKDWMPEQSSTASRRPAVALSSSGEKICVAMQTGFRVIWVDGGVEVCHFELTGNEAVMDSGFTQEVRFSPDDSTVILGMDIWTRIFDAETGKPVGEKAVGDLTPGFSHDITCTSDGRLMFFAGLKQAAGVWDMRRGKRVQAFGGQQSSCVSLSPDEKLLAVSYANRRSRSDGVTEILRLDLGTK